MRMVTNKYFDLVIGKEKSIGKTGENGSAGLAETQDGEQLAFEQGLITQL